MATKEEDELEVPKHSHWDEGEEDQSDRDMSKDDEASAATNESSTKVQVRPSETVSEAIPCARHHTGQNDIW